MNILQQTARRLERLEALGKVARRTPVLAETELADGELCRAGAAAAAMRCQPATVNGRHLLSVLVDGPAEDLGQARRRSNRQWRR
jgi:hypothetical protein